MIAKALIHNSVPKLIPALVTVMALFTNASNLLAQSSPLTIQPSTGRVGVNTSNPGYTLDVTGTVNATGFRGDGSQLTNLPNSGGVTALNKVTTNVVILGNTTAETTLYSFAVPGGTLGTNGSLRLTLRGTILSNAIGFGHTLRIKYGATTLSSDFQIQNASAGLQVWKVVIEPSGDGATNSQILSAEGMVSWINTGEDPLNVWSSTGGELLKIARGTSAIDSTTSQNLSVTGQWAANVGSNANITLEYAILEKLS